MAVLLDRSRVLLCRHPEVRAHLARASKDACLAFFASTILRGSPSGASAPQGSHLWMTSAPVLHPRHIELRLLAGAVAAQRAVFADCVGALKNPVLPRREAREDFRFHGLGAYEAQIGFHAGEAIGRERRAFLQEHPHLV